MNTADVRAHTGPAPRGRARIVAGARAGRRPLVAGYWVVTALFCLQIGFTAFAQLRLPQVAAAFTHLGFPAYFRVELSWAKFIGVALLLVPVSARLKEWAYAGFAFTLVSALIAHLSRGDGIESWGWAVGTGLLWALSYAAWRRLQVAPASPRPSPGI